MDSLLRERFARLGPIQAVDQTFSGSPGVFVLHLQSDEAAAKTVDGALTLARRGLPLLCAKRAMEELLATSSVFVDLPAVEDPRAVVAELADAAISAALVDPRPVPDVCQLRERLRLTR